jgi:hypothetical protein
MYTCILRFRKSQKVAMLQWQLTDACLPKTPNSFAVRWLARIILYKINDTTATIIMLNTATVAL